MTRVRINKGLWSTAVVNWLVYNIGSAKFNLNETTLYRYDYFEYIFINDEDALAFRLAFNTE